MICYQFVVLALISILLCVGCGTLIATSFATGALAYWLPTLGFMLWMSRFGHARAVASFLAAFMAGEFIKLLVSGILFIVGIKTLRLEVVWAVLGLVAAVLTFWIVTLTVLYVSESKK